MKTLHLSLIFGVLVCLNSCVPVSESQSLEGEWSCHETSEIFLESQKATKGTSIFPVYFAQDVANDNKYYIDNFYQLGDGTQVSILISGERSITIETQTVSGIEFSGSGTIDASFNSIDLTYTADDGGGEIDHVVATYTR